MNHEETYDFSEPSQEEIDAQAEGMENKFSDMSADKVNSKVEVCCPYCSETFNVNKGDLK